MFDIIWPELVVLIIGVLYRFFPPKKINDLHGYRSKTSLKSPELWMAGNRISGNGFIIAAIVTGCVGWLLFELDVPSYRLINIVLVIASVFVVTRITENKLNKR